MLRFEFVYKALYGAIFCPRRKKRKKEPKRWCKSFILEQRAQDSMERSKLSDFETLNKLGAGSFGTVFRVRRLLDEKIYVIKDVRIGELSFKEQEEAINEVNILAGLDSQYIVGYYDSFIETGSLHIVMEYCNRGDLQGLVKKAKAKDIACLKEHVTWNIALQVILGLNCLHNKFILHRDLKSANVFLQKDETQTYFSVKIGDLGVAKLLETSTAFAQTIVGTPYYLSPELCADQPYRDKSDCWALGVLLYECCTLCHPFEARNQCALILKIIQAKVKPPENNTSPELSKLIMCLLQKDPLKRPRIKEILCEEVIRQKLEEHCFDLPLELVNEPTTNFLASGPLIHESPEKEKEEEESEDPLFSIHNPYKRRDNNDNDTINSDFSGDDTYSRNANRLFREEMGETSVDNEDDSAIKRTIVGGASDAKPDEDRELSVKMETTKMRTNISADNYNDNDNDQMVNTSNGSSTANKANTVGKSSTAPVGLSNAIHKPSMNVNATYIRGDRVRGGAHAKRTTSSKVLTRHQVQSPGSTNTRTISNNSMNKPNISTGLNSPSATVDTVATAVEISVSEDTGAKSISVSVEDETAQEKMSYSESQVSGQVEASSKQLAKEEEGFSQTKSNGSDYNFDDDDEKYEEDFNNEDTMRLQNTIRQEQLGLQSDSKDRYVATIKIVDNLGMSINATDADEHENDEEQKIEENYSRTENTKIEETKIEEREFTNRDRSHSLDMYEEDFEDYDDEYDDLYEKNENENEFSPEYMKHFGIEPPNNNSSASASKGVLYSTLDTKADYEAKENDIICANSKAEEKDDGAAGLTVLQTTQQLDELHDWIDDTRKILIRDLGDELFQSIYLLCKDNMRTNTEKEITEGKGGDGTSAKEKGKSNYLYEIQKKLQDHLHAGLEVACGVVMQIKALLAWEQELDLADTQIN